MLLLQQLALIRYLGGPPSSALLVCPDHLREQLAARSRKGSVLALRSA
jgi:hypothetical protein